MPSEILQIHSEVLRDLVADHALIRRYLGILEKAVSRGAVATASPELLDELRSFVDDFVDAIHHVKEDVIFFSAVAARAKAAERRLQETIDEHEQGWQHAEGMRMAVQEQRPGWRTAYNWNAVGLVRTVRNHLEAEEKRLFPLLDRAIGAEFDGEVVAHIERKLGDVEEIRERFAAKLGALEHRLRLDDEDREEER